MAEAKTGAKYWLFDLVLYLIAALFLLVALAITAIRYYPNVSDIVEREIESKLAQAINSEISIESLDIHRRQKTPEIIAQNVVITDKQDATQTWRIKRILLGVNIIDSLLSRSLRFSEISIEGVDIELLRDVNGDVRINKSFLLPNNMLQGDGSNDFDNVMVHLLDSSIRWQDELTEIDYEFDELDVLIDARSYGHALLVSGNLPKQLGGALQAHVKIEGDIKNLAEANVTFHVDAKSVEFAKIASNHLDLNFALPVKTGSFEIWGKLENSSLVSLLGDAVVNEFIPIAKDYDKKICVSNEALESVALRFSLNRKNEQWSFDAKDIQIATSQKNWLGAEIQVDFAQKNVSKLLGRFDQLDLGGLCNALYAYDLVTPELDSALKRYQVDGEFRDLHIRYQHIDDSSPLLNYSGKVFNAGVKINETAQSIKAISGSFVGDASAGSLSLDSEQTRFLLPILYPNQELSFNLNGDVHWQKYDDVLTVDTDQFHIQNSEMEINARWHSSIIDGEIYVDSQFNVPSTQAKFFPKYFPSHPRVVRTKNWATHAAQGGQLNDAVILLRGKLKDFPFHKKSGVFEVDLDIDKGLMEYKVGWPMLDNVQADIHVNKARVDISAQQATMFDSQLKDIDITIQSFLRAVMYAQGTVDGPWSRFIEIFR